ncbi:UDP-N-acetylglucosamine 2-epimerase [uncultured archaeon]|nr:UDP-N-acetylglucosamine 2-epimerase [uncultured archaeon]
MKILTIIGTQPEAIKMAPVIRAIKKDSSIKHTLCVTAQHRELLDQALNLFEITPDVDLNIMGSNQDLFDITTRSLAGLKKVIENKKPDLILVQGDTTTALAGALAGFYTQTPVAHIEAGLRSGDINSPFPEEANRVLISKLASIHFAPTKKAEANLLAEKIPAENIHVTGNTVVDALKIARKKTRNKKDWRNTLGPIADLTSSNKTILLATIHRRENFGEGVTTFCKTLKHLATKHPNWNIVVPVHPNPNVEKPVRAALSKTRNIHLTKQLDYLSFIHLLSKSKIIITDSGGIQEEAPSFNKPVLLMREKTDRPESVEQGAAVLVGRNAKKIIKETETTLSNKNKHRKITLKNNPYGNGKAAQKIIKTLSRTQPKKTPVKTH